MTHPGERFRRHRIRYLTPIEQWGADEFLARIREDGGTHLILTGPNETLGYTFSGLVELVPCLRRSDRPDRRDYLFLCKLWDNGSGGRKKIPKEAEGLEVSPEEFASEMRRQRLIVATDKYANARLYWDHLYGTYARLVGGMVAR